MKTTVLIAGILAVGSALATGPTQGAVNKPLEISLGGVWFTGDLADAPLNFDGGFLVGVDYYMPMNGSYAMGPNTSWFVGGRGWFADKSGQRVNTFGAHAGLRFGMNGGGSGTNNLYFKVAGGIYNTSFDPGSDKTGFGGFVGVGWMLQGNASLEAGFQMGPSNSGINNTAFYGAVTFRL